MFPPSLWLWQNYFSPSKSTVLGENWKPRSTQKRWALKRKSIHSLQIQSPNVSRPGPWNKRFESLYIPYYRYMIYPYGSQVPPKKIQIAPKLYPKVHSEQLLGYRVYVIPKSLKFGCQVSTDEHHHTHRGAKIHFHLPTTWLRHCWPWEGCFQLLSCQAQLLPTTPRGFHSNSRRQKCQGEAKRHGHGSMVTSPKDRDMSPRFSRFLLTINPTLGARV